MSDPQLSAIAAMVGGTVLAVLLFVPYVWWSYRRRGEFGLMPAMLAFGFLVYAIALWTYTLLPLPDATASWCAEHAVRGPQLRPLRFLADIRADQVGSGVRATLHNPAVQQVVFNVILFVPLGMFGRHLFRRGPVTVIAAAALVSAFIETTQLTAVWGLFECPYRLFDVDDLLANTAGGAVGFVLGPVLRLVPGQKVSAPARAPRPVTTSRRLLGMALDVIAVTMLGGALQVLVNAVWIYVLDRPTGPVHWAWLTATALPALIVVVVVPLFGGGATLGQRIVLLKPVGPDGRPPSVGRGLVRCLAGTGGFYLLSMLGLGLFALALVGVSAVMAWRPRDHRGLSGVVAGLRVVDARPVMAEPEGAKVA